MGYRNIFISSSARLSLKNNQLVVKAEQTYTFPLEDVSSIMMENTQSNISSALLAYCAANGVSIYFCDNTHTPCGILTGYNTHSRKLKILSAQINNKPTICKQLWKDIIVAKIQNQAKVLSINGMEDYSKQLIDISKKVKPADQDNMEAVAASKYFKMIFGDDFTRRNEDIVNARLNYGYAVVRGAVCRILVSYGLEPALGLHHKSQLNQFNLADDIIEIFRPLVDLCVVNMPQHDTDRLTPTDKQVLYNLVNCNVLFDNKKYPLSYAIEKTVQTLQASILEQKNLLKTCKIIPLEQHQYE